MNPVVQLIRVQPRGRSYCSVNGCFNSSEHNPDISFFKHPADVERRLKWLQLIGREELIDRPAKNYCVCEDHFNVQDVLVGMQRKKLKKNALPALHLPVQQQSPSDETVMDMNTSIKIEESDIDTPSMFAEPLPEGTRKRKLASPLPGCSTTNELEPQDETVMDMKTSIKIEECDIDIDTPSIFAEPLPERTRKRRLASPPPGCSSTNELEPQDETVIDMKTSIKIEECDIDTPSMFAESLPEGTRKRRLASPPPGCDQFLTKELADIFKAQSNLKSIEEKKCLDFNLISLHLYHSNPQAYRMLRGALRLPCSLGLHNNAIPITSEIKGNFMSLFKSKVDTMTDMEKNCSAVISYISVKPNLFYSIDNDIIVGFLDINGIRLPDVAGKAYVMMVRGIYSNWKQPVGYALLPKGEKSVEFNEWIDGLLEQLFKIGLNVRTFVSDTGTEFIDAAKNRAVTIEKPYFFISDRKIYYIFDGPHLIKLVRNLFIEQDFLFQDRRAKYEHVRSFYQKEKTKQYKLAPKLTRSHIQPTNFEKNEIRYAAQLLSNSVATGILTYVDFYVIEKSGKDTADFIKLMNNLFDSLNSFVRKDDTNEYKSAFRGTKSQIDLFNEMLIFFRDIKFCDIKVEPRFIEGFQITITSILQLFDDIKTEGYAFLPTRRLNLEVIDHLFNQVRTKYGIASQLTSWQFVSTYRKILISHLMKPQGRKNDAEDLTKWLIQIQTNQFKPALSDKPVNVFLDPNNDGFKVMTSDYNKQEFKKKHRLFETSHHLLAKCAEKHDCKFFRSYTKPYKNIPDFINENRYRGYRKYSKDQCKSLLVVPCDNFVEFVKRMDAQFVQCFIEVNSKRNVAQLLFNSIIDVPYNCPPCGCFPKYYLVKLFVRMNIYNVIKLNNKALSLYGMNCGRLVISPL